MGFLKSLLDSIWGLFDRLLCVALAFLFSLSPAFFHQYTETLGEVRANAETTFIELDARAAQFDLDLDSYLNRHELVPDSLRLDNPALMQDIVARYRRYDEAYRRLKEAASWQRPFTFIAVYDRSIRSALDFHPVVDFSLVGLFYALLGVLVALLLIGLIRAISKWFQKRFTKPKPVYDPYKYRRKDQG